MARKKVPKRQLTPDQKYQDVRITSLINYIMLQGKKDLARKLVYTTFEKIEKKTQKNAMEIFSKAEEHVRPRVEVRSRRIGGANFQIPKPVREPRQFQLFLRWIIQAAKARREKTMIDRLTNEFIEASRGEGSAVKKRLSMDKKAQAQKAYSHLR